MKDDNDVNNKRILIVDDEPDITLYFSMILRESGFIVDVFNDPLLALSSFREDLYDMAILDIRMPKISGLKLGTEIRKIDEKIEISFITAYDIHDQNLKEDEVTAVSSMLDKEKPLIMRKSIFEKDFVSKIKEKLYG